MKNIEHDEYKNELINAYRILFTPNIDVSINLLKYLDLTAIKDRYRVEAFETHPDRARVLGKNEIEMTKRFTNVNHAYEKLCSFINENQDSLKFNSLSSKRGNNEGKAKWEYNQKKNNDFNNINCPKFELPIGQFLYYNGCISWKNLLNAIFWQREKRPSFGQIAKCWGILTESDIIKIRRGRNYREKFGEFALNNGYISLFEHIAIMGKQRRLQPLIGEFFIQKKIISNSKMDEMIEKQSIHNRRIKFGRKETNS